MNEEAANHQNEGAESLLEENNFSLLASSTAMRHVLQKKRATAKKGLTKKSCSIEAYQHLQRSGGAYSVRTADSVDATNRPFHR